MKKVGIITFHNSFNCGSMLESYAIQTYLKSQKVDCEIIDFSNEGQREMYSTFEKNNSIKKIIKNLIIFPHRKKINFNNEKYKEFKYKYFNLSQNEYKYSYEIKDEYDLVVAGSDQIWNITIPDSDDAYFLNWCKNGKKIAYAPSFGAKNIMDFPEKKDHYCSLLKQFDKISIRENNGKKWIKDLIGKEVPVLIDPTLLLDRKDYDILLDDNLELPDKYIFFYAPSFDRNICEFVKKISKKYNMKVITWSAKSYYKKFVKQFGFELASYENPSSYLTLIKNADLVLTTSFHGTIFSTIYRKRFYTIKNGGMYENDDRVKTLLNQIGLEERLVDFEFREEFNYLDEPNYRTYEMKIPLLQKEAKKYLRENVENCLNEKS